MELISVVVPVYNVEKYLRRNLDSLVNQTYKNIEIIVVNDGSPDNSEKIVKEYQKKYGRIIRYYKNANGGLSYSRNFGLSKAKGKYIAFVDSDDYVDSDFIELLYKSVKKNKSQIAICDIYDEYENNNKVLVVSNYVPSRVSSIFEDKKQMLNRFATWNKLYDIKLFDNEELRFADKRIYEDLRLTPKLYLEANKISFVQKPLYHYIIRNGSIMTSSDIKKNYEVIAGFEDLIEYYRRRKVFNSFQCELEFMAIQHVLIAASSRVAKMSKLKDIKHNIKPFYEYIINNFPNYQNNKYIQSLSTGSKVVLKLINLNMFWLLKLLLKIKG